MWICAAGRGKAVCTKRVFYKSNGRSPHRTLAFKGSRFTATFYCHRSCFRMSRSVRAELVRLGANVPTKRGMERLQDWSLVDEQGTCAARMAKGRKEWMRFTGAKKSRITPGRKPGQHAQHAWVCGWCGKRGSQTWGSPRQWCSNACKMSWRRAVRKMSRGEGPRDACQLGGV